MVHNSILESNQDSCALHAGNFIREGECKTLDEIVRERGRLISLLDLVESMESFILMIWLVFYPH